MKNSKFEIILSKNRLARDIKELYRELKEPIPKRMYFDFEEIEKATGTANQPTAEQIFNSNYDI